MDWQNVSRFDSLLVFFYVHPKSRGPRCRRGERTSERPKVKKKYMKDISNEKKNRRLRQGIEKETIQEVGKEAITPMKEQQVGDVEKGT